MLGIEVIEKQRLEIQNLLDSAKTKPERNRLGQFSTPTELARDILKYAKDLLPEPHQHIRFLDPAFGTGAFYSALLSSFEISHIESAQGYEIDPRLAQPSKDLWAGTPLNLEVADFTKAAPPASNDDKANLLICNPPYVRHHHLSTEEKKRLQNLIRNRVNIKLSGLAGLYCYFLLITHDWLAKGGLAGWLIPSEFMDVNYGRQVKQYLLHKVTLLHIHRFSPEDVQFGDALVSSAIVWFKKSPPPPNHKVRFSYGGSLLEPRTSNAISTIALRQSEKWTEFPQKSGGLDKSNQEARDRKLSHLFSIKRGIATGANNFFILAAEQIKRRSLPQEFFTPILPSPRYLSTDEIDADENGNPILDQQLFLLTCNLPENIVKVNYPSLWGYLQEGIQNGIDKRYLCRHRSPWYSQESRPASPLLCTYMGRMSSGNEKPFRFILNHSRATAPNVYLMLYPKPVIASQLAKLDVLRAVWKALDEIAPVMLVRAGRVYGGGLHKIEPKELANAPANGVMQILLGSGQYPKQLSFFQ
jgi:adenine-specific DNA-methyltransferase